MLKTNILAAYEYEYDYESQAITYPLDTGGKVNCLMAIELFTYYGNNCDIELNFHDDDAKDLCFKIDGQFYTALQIIQDAESVHDDLRRECEAETYEKPYLQSEFI